MTKRIPIICWAFIALMSRLYSQPVADTILVYDLATQTTSTILPLPFNTAITSDYTSSSPGTMGNIASLSQLPPTTNVYSGSAFSKLTRAASFFPVTSYPARTTVRLHQYFNDSLDYVWTGMMVGPCLVLTTAATIANFTMSIAPFKAFDSIRVSPAFNNGALPPGIPSTVVKKIYMFKNFYDQTSFENIVLLELRDPIGSQLGWTGIGFNTNTNFISTKVFHKFSYPATTPPNTTTPAYNGDTLYYEYGQVNDGNPFYYVNSCYAVPGQDGSTLLYSDNTNYYSIGLLSFSTNYSHYKITNAAFYRLKNVMATLSCNAITTSISDFSNGETELKLYPNPLRDITTLEFDYDPNKHYKLQIINSLGQEVLSLSPDNSRVEIQREQLETGIYFIHLSSERGETRTTKLLVD